MKLETLAQALPHVLAVDRGEVEVRDVVCDSRRAAPFALFAAVRGVKTDGHRFLRNAALAGASACLIDEPGADTHGMASLLVASVEEALGHAAATLWGRPSHDLTLVGITGTNGKTTVAHILQHILNEAGILTGRLGTIGYAFPSGEEPASLTTPDAPTFQRALARMRDEGAKAVVAEVSSHALARKRVAGANFACAIFTNLTQDHLDYHGTIENYFEAKKLLFTGETGYAEAIINADDPWGVRLAQDIGGHAVTYGLVAGEIRFAIETCTVDGTGGTLHYPGGSTPLTVPLIGAHNGANVAAALAAAWGLGLDIHRAVQAAATVPQTPGRLEALRRGQPFGAFVDYAHTPDALDRVLASVRAITEGRVICLFGCGGDRDRDKRPLMAAATARRADVAVITADNSRSESTETILDEIEGGFPKHWSAGEATLVRPVPGTYYREPDRHAAIALAAALCRPGDTLVVAGKGHETTMTMGEVVVPFDDREVLAEVLDHLLHPNGGARCA